MTRAFWLSLTFLSVYAIVFGVFVYGGLDEWLAPISGRIAAGVVAGLTDTPIHTRVEDGALWIRVAGVQPFPVQTALLNLHLPLYIAVVSAAARSYGRRFWALLLGGMAIIFALESLALAARLWSHAESVLPHTALYPLFAAADSVLGLPAVPAFIGALLAWNLPPPPARAEPDDDAADAGESS